MNERDHQSAPAQPSPPLYVIVTPARNEERFIETTIKSVVAQTIRPLRWVIVSDGSTDRTDEIVSRYCAEHSWISLVRMPERKERHFAGKVLAFNAGYASLADVEYDYIASLDADIAFDEKYFDYLLDKLSHDARLGIVGTPFREGDAMYDYRFVSIEHVSGACQLFRRRCFEEIGGYVPMKGGGIDHTAVLTARMKGWRTRTFTDKVSTHHREMGSAKHGPLRTKFNVGKLDYALGGHPLWEAFRCLYQTTKPPYVLGGMMIMVGYTSSLLAHRERSISPALVAFRRHEQMARLRRFLLPGRRAEIGSAPPSSGASNVEAP
jgi:glycosyltransferase involved in cell wall biosynthesis